MLQEKSSSGTENSEDLGQGKNIFLVNENLVQFRKRYRFEVLL